MKYILVCASVIVLVAYLAFNGYKKAEVDDEARRLCDKDGGITIFETVDGQTNNIDPTIKFFLSPIGREREGDRYAYAWSSKDLKQGSLSLSRDVVRIVRLSDGKTLGQLVSYMRIGGDIPSPLPASTFRCPIDLEINGLIKDVFVHGEAR